METNELIKLRQRFGYTQLDIANMLGLPKSTYNQKRMANGLLNRWKWFKSMNFFTD